MLLQCGEWYGVCHINTTGAVLPDVDGDQHSVGGIRLAGRDNVFICARSSTRDDAPLRSLAELSGPYSGFFWAACQP